MSLFILLRQLKSSCKLRIKTVDAERIINILCAENIYIWGVEKRGGELNFWVSEGSVPHVRQAASRFGLEVEITETQGLTRTLQRLYARRAAIILGVFVLFALALLSRCIWAVDIYGARTVSESELRALLYQSGFRESAPRSGLDLYEAERLIKHIYPVIYDVDCEIVGTRLLVTVFEAASPPALIDRSTPCDLVATRDGVIDEMYVQSGKAMCKVGDSVKSGDVIISGTLEYLYRERPGVDYVHALGRVLSYESREFDDIKINLYEQPQTAPAASERVFYLFGRVFRISKQPTDGDLVGFEQKNCALSIGWLKLPILYDEIKWYNVDDCIAKSEAAIYTEIEAAVSTQLNDGALLRSLSYTFADGEHGTFTAKVYADVSVNLAAEREIMAN